MLASNQLPVVFLACVNCFAEGQRLRHLIHERKAIHQLLSKPEIPFYQPIQKCKLSTESYLEPLEQFQYHQRISFLHLTGHKSNDRLMVEADGKETELTWSQLSQLLDKLPNLQCVYLSGCATPELIDFLLRKDIPAIMATQVNDRNSESSAIAYTFYSYITRGESIRRAFDLLKERHPNMGEYSVQYDIEKDEMGWKGSNSDGEMNWGLYFLEEHKERLTFSPKQRPLLRYESPSYRWGKRRGLRRLSFASMALLLGLIAVSLVLSLQSIEAKTLLSAF